MLRRWALRDRQLGEPAGCLCLSTLTERADGRFAGKEAVRLGVSKLVERRFNAFSLAVANSGDIEGSAGTSSLLTRPKALDGRRGDASRNVLVLIELELADRRMRFLLLDRILTDRRDDTEDCRCSIRFVWTFSTAVGVGVTLRKAAAAAAEDKLFVEGWDLRKAWVAALCAERVSVAPKGGYVYIQRSRQ